MEQLSAGGAPELVAESALTPAQLPPGALSLWLDASVGVETHDGRVSRWNDRAFDGDAIATGDLDEPTIDLKTFGKHPGVHFDGIWNKLVISDQNRLQVGTGPFVLELVLANESQNCCFQFVFFKEEIEPPYRGISVTVNMYRKFQGKTIPPATGEFAAFLTIEPDILSTPFSDSEDYRDGKPRVLSMLRTEEEFSIRVNGQVLGSLQNNAVDASAAGQDIVLGSYPDIESGLAFQGSLAEVVLARDLTAEQAIALDRSLLIKYADALAK